MAIWEYQCILLPKDSENLISKLTFEDLLGNDILEKRKISFDFKSFLSPYFKEDFSEEDQKIWYQNESKIVINYYKDIIYEIRLRLDLRSFDKEILLKFCDLSLSLDCIIVSIHNNNFRMLEPKENILINDIIKSDSFKFVDNPKKFISDIII
jgi:hypothetical protein